MVLCTEHFPLPAACQVSTSSWASDNFYPLPSPVLISGARWLETGFGRGQWTQEGSRIDQASKALESKDFLSVNQEALLFRDGWAVILRASTCGLAKQDILGPYLKAVVFKCFDYMDCFGQTNGTFRRWHSDCSDWVPPARTTFSSWMKAHRGWLNIVNHFVKHRHHCAVSPPWIPEEYLENSLDHILKNRVPYIAQIISTKTN